MRGQSTPGTTIVWRVGGERVLHLPAERPVLMAILNLTPDSFSDGGAIGSPAAAAETAERAVREGSGVLDIGGESTRPGAARVSEAEQIARVVPAILAIRRAVGPRVPITIDTTRWEVARAALDAGADGVNDVSGGTEDGRMLAGCAERGAGIVLMHRLVPPEADQYSDRYERAPEYADVVEDVRRFLESRLRAARDAGVRADAIALDPGLGFGKTVEQNLALIRGSRRLAELGAPIVSGISRKSFAAHAGGMGASTRPAERLAASIALSVAHFATGARLWRVHDIESHARASRALDDEHLRTDRSPSGRERSV
ncbi:MAG: dihydropteroate synthase [Phycisphaerales bacterium]